MATPKAQDPKGYSGLTITRGIYTDRDRNSKFRGQFNRYGTQSRYGEAEVMLATDTTIETALEAMIDTIAAGEHEIVKGSAAGNETPQDVADLVHNAMFEWPSVAYEAFLRERYRAKWFGFYTFENVLRRHDTPQGPVITVDHFAARMPWTIDQWDVEGGVLQGVVQGAYGSSGFDRVYLDAEDITHFVHRQIGNDFRGTPLFRNIHPLWLQKQELWQQRIIGHDRNNVGIPMATWTDDSNPPSRQDIDEMYEFLRDVRVHENSSIQPGPNWSLDWFVNEHWAAQAGEIREDLKQLNAEIFQRFLLGQLAIGLQGSTGSFASAKVMEQPLFKRAEAWAREDVAALNGTGNAKHTGIIKRLVDLNFPGYAESGDPYPYLHVSGIRTRDLAEWAAAAVGFAQARNQLPDDLQELWRERLGAKPTPDEGEDDELESGEDPDAEPEMDSEPEVIEVQGVDEDEQEPPIAASLTFARGFQPPRELHEDESRVAWAKINGRLDLGVQEYEATVKRLVFDHADRIAEAAADGPMALRDAVMELGAAARQRLDELSADIAGFGYGQVAREARVQAQGGDAEGVAVRAQERFQVEARKRREMSRRLAAGIPPEIADQLTPAQRVELEAEIQDAIEAGVANVEAVVLEAAASAKAERGQLVPRVIDRVRDAILSLGGSSSLRRGGFGFTTTAFNVGREAFAAEHGDQLQTARISEVLDGNTCGPCAAHDGMEFEDPMNDPDFEAHRPPYSECEGGSRCRGVTVFTFRDPAGLE